MILFAVLFCLLLCGCCSEPAPPPQETAPALYAREDAALSRRYGLDARVLPARDLRRAISWGDDLLLIGGQDDQQLTVMDSCGRELAQSALAGLENPFCPGFQVGAWISWYSPETGITTVLDRQLQTVRQIQLPPEVSGVPLLSSDGQTLYYCTSTALYGWNLDSGIRRRILEFSPSTYTLTGILLEDTLLACRCADGSTAFLSPENGQLIRRFHGDIALATLDRRYFASFQQGFRQTLIFSDAAGVPRSLFPRDLYSEGTFLPELDAAVTLSRREDGLTLEAYSLASGSLLDSLELDVLHAPLSITSWGSSVLLLIYAPETDSNVLLLWSPDRNTAGTDHTDLWYPDQTPNQPGLTVCQSRAAALSQKYGITIRIWEDAAAVQPWDYSFLTEHLYQPLIEALETLDSILAQYPANVLRDTAAHFDSLNLCLVRSITSAAGGSLETATGIQFLNGRDAYVTVALGPWFRQAVYHELFHVIEIHILTGSTALDHWDDLNPAGFAYDLNFSANAQRNSGIYLEGVHRAFVDTYSMSYPREDRARVFEYAMLPDQGALFSAPGLQKKLQAICQGIREAYGLNQVETLLWEQYLE